jgi:signal transduction histidine kinase
VEESIGLLDSLGVAAVIAVPRGSDSPSLLFALGPKHSLRPYTYPDIVLLLSLAELMDNILSHARLSAHSAKISRMEAAAMMSRGLAHDLNNLTTPVSTYLLHRESQDPPGSAEAEVYNAARNSIKVMQDYIRESLFFARKLIPEFKDVDAAEIVASAGRLAEERAARRNVKLKIVSDGALPFTADYALVQRLVLNLVHNAIDASRPGAVVEISAARRDPDQICIVVADQGAGIPPEIIRRIFDPFFTTKDTGDEVRGLGLGLAICRKIADLHGGEIELTGRHGHGAVFTAVFPKSPVHSRPDNSVADKPLGFMEYGERAN